MYTIIGLGKKSPLRSGHLTLRSNRILFPRVQISFKDRTAGFPASVHQDKRHTGLQPAADIFQQTEFRTVIPQKMHDKDTGGAVKSLRIFQIIHISPCPLPL